MNSDDLIHNAKQVVLNNLQNPQFGVSVLARELNISRSELYRRIKTSHNRSVSQFIREIRLEKAAELLRTNKYSVAEIAYMVGFNSPTYFSTCFKEHYGYSPSEPEAHLTKREIVTGKKIKIWAVPVALLAILIVISLVAVGIKNGQGNQVQKSLAVLKFEYVGADSTDSFLAHAVADEIINNLSNLGSPNVITASSSFKVDKKDDITKIGRKLGVNYVVDGSLWRDKTRLKTTVKLIDVRTGFQLWSETYEEQFEDFFDIQKNIAEKVAEELQISLYSNREFAENRKRTRSLKAFELYVKAMELGEMRSGESIDRAIELLDKTVSLDPNFAEAYAELSFLYGQKHYYGTLNREERNKMMKINMQRAFELSPESPEVLFAKADYDFKTGNLHRDSTKIISNFRKVLKMKPNYARCSYRLYQVLEKIGQHDEAHWYLENAVGLDPLNPFYKTILARNYFWKKENREKGFSLINEVLKENTGHQGAVYFKSLMFADEPRGDLIAAYKVLHEALKEDPYNYGFLYWGSFIALDLDLLPIAKKYTQLIQVRFPDNPKYTYEPVLKICIIEKRFEDALNLTKIWVADKKLDKDIAAERMARIYYLKGEHGISKKILLDQFLDLFKKVENGQLSGADLENSDVAPIRTYIGILRKEGKENLALKYADFLNDHFRFHGNPTVTDSPFVDSKKFALMEYYYLHNDLDRFLDEVEAIFFETKSRLALFSTLSSLKYIDFHSEPEYQELYDKIQRETHDIRSEAAEYLKEQGDWSTSWNNELQLNIQ